MLVERASESHKYRSIVQTPLYKYSDEIED